MDNMYLSGTGNNFLITENTKDLSDIEVIAYIADTNKDIDGVITYEIKDNNLLHMNYYNSDGSTAELCINGVRCLAKYANDNVANIDSNVTILTQTQRIDCVVEKDIVTVEVDYPTFPDDLKLHKIENLSGYIVDVGNPHFVIFDKGNLNFDIEKISTLIQDNSLFPNGVNIEYCDVLDETSVKARVYERGVGETAACGSGAVAIFYSLFSKNIVRDNLKVMYPGGDLHLSINNDKIKVSGYVTYL